MLNLIVNPQAGNGLALKNMKIVVKHLKSEKVAYMVYFCEKIEAIKATTQNLIDTQEKDIVIIGGDGTIHNVINSVTDLKKINIGIIPSGKNNNFAKTLFLPKNPLEAINNILENNVIQVDYFIINSKIKCCNATSFGATQSIKHKLITENKKTSIFNIFSYIKAIKNPEPLELNFFGEELNNKKVFIQDCYICNGQYVGKNHISPLSNIQDGLLNIICIQNKNKIRLLDFWDIYKGKHIKKESCSNYWADDFKITCSKLPIKTLIDGEPYELEELNIQTIENGLNIFNCKK